MKPFDWAKTVATLLATTISLSYFNAPAQSDVEPSTNIDWSSASDAQVILQGIELTTPLSADQAPLGAAYYSALHSPISASPWPPLPANVLGLPVWDLGDHMWLIDDVSVDYSAPLAGGHMMAMDGLEPPGSGGTNIFSPSDSFVPFDPGTNLWIAQENVSNGIFSGILSNTLADVGYQLLSANSLDSTQWFSQGFILGSEVTNWTAWSIPFSPTTNFFLNALSFQGDTGTGIPNWWWLKYFGQYTNVDPYADPTGDGWTLFQDYQKGWNPTIFQTSPAPQGLAINSFNSGSDTASLSWLPSPGPVSGYTLQTPGGNINISSNVTSYIDDESAVGATYAVQANYSGGNSTWSDSVSVNGDPRPIAAIVPGPEGKLYLVASGLPPDLAAVQISRNSWNSDGPINNAFQQSAVYIDQGNFPTDPLADGSFQIPVADITNGICEIPSSEVTPFFLYQFEIETIRSNGVTSATTQSGSQFGYPLAEVPFVDGRADFKDNLRFLFRAAGDADYGGGSFQFNNFVWPSDHICVDFYSDGGTSSGYPLISAYPDALEPLEDNIFYKNFVWNAGNVTNIIVPPSTVATVIPNTGITYPNLQSLDFYYGDIPDPEVEYYLSVNAFMANPVVQSSAISAGSSTYLMVSSLDVALNFYQNFPYTGDTNVYGLPFVAAVGAWYTNNTYYNQTYSPGDPNLNGWPYPDAQEPDFQTGNYYFCRPRIDAMPEDVDFAPTNTTPLLIVPVGGQIQLAGYAQMAVTNGYPGVCGYLGQYFANAYLIDSDGNVTTNTTGVLSPYGQFFATQPAPVALVTMPDIDTGEQGTGVVNCVSLQVDKNHDGAMDLSWNGPDATSQSSPMEFWVNNRYYSADQGDLMAGNGIPPDYSLGSMTGQRDLENFARLWICGMPVLTNGYEVTLSWAHVSGGTPGINLYDSVETNGGTGYLTDTNIALEQCTFTYSPYSLAKSGAGAEIAAITNGASYTFPSTYFTNGGNNYFIFEGAGIGAGELVLTITDNDGNVVAQTGVWLDLHDVGDFYEQVHTVNTASVPPSTNVSALVEDQILATNANEAKQLVMFVHGLNVGYLEYRSESETMFRRLYWQGYQGRFAAFDWPSPLFTMIPTGSNDISYFGYNTGEYISWQSGTALKAYIDDLRNRLQGYSINIAVHSLGNVAANEAIREGAQVDNYVLMQAAIGAGAFDGNNTNLIYDYLAATASSSPDADILGGYNNCATNQCRRVNFYNDDDFALFGAVVGSRRFHTWEGNQLDYKPDTYIYLGVLRYSYSFDGVNCFYIEDLSDGSLVTNRMVTSDFEKKAYIARSRTKAVGAAGSKYAPFALTGGAITDNVSLQDASLGFVGGAVFGATRPDHSGEFTKPIQNTVPFYKELLQDGFLITPNP